MSKSYPYLAISRRYDLDYGDVLLYAEWLMDKKPLEFTRVPIREAVKRLSEEANVLIQKDFRVAVMEAVGRFRHIQKFGWD